MYIYIMIFTNVEVIKTEQNFFHIEWEVAASPVADTPPATPDTIDNYTFQIYWARDPASGFIPVLDSYLTPIEIDGAVGPLIYLHKLEQYDFNQDSYYKILATKKDQTESFFSKMVFVGNLFDGIQDSIRYVEDVLHRLYYGEPSKLIKRKSFGARCSKCWSEERQQRILSHCDTCNSTGYGVGFYKPIPVQMSFDSSPKKSDSLKDYENSFDIKRARLSNYPIVRPKDVVVNSDNNRRYVVTHVEVTKLPMISTFEKKFSRQNYILSQMLVLDEIISSDDEYLMDIEAFDDVPNTDDGGSGSTDPASDKIYRYYGTNSKTVLTNSDVLAFSKEQCLNAISDHSYNCSGGKYIWICQPTSLPIAEFEVAGFITTFDVVAQTVVDANGVSRSYSCYKSYRIQNGSDIPVRTS